jgi:hypothetical protein
MSRRRSSSGKKALVGCRGLPDDRIKGDFSLTWEIIPQPSLDRVLAGAGAPYLEKMAEKTSYIPPSLVSEASPKALTAEAEGKWRDAGARAGSVF